MDGTPLPHSLLQGVAKVLSGLKNGFISPNLLYCSKPGFREQNLPK
jgi:hypothetical protein